jgi:riboflavin transporter FmnP
MLITRPQQSVTSPNDWLSNVRRLLLGFGAGVLPGAAFLAIARGLIPAAHFAPVLGVAYAIYLIGLPAAAWTVRPSGRTTTSIGNLVGFAASTIVLLVLLVQAPGLAASAS